MKNQEKRDVRRAANIKDTAEAMGVSTSLVRKTLDMTRNNDKVVEVFMFLHEGKNLLLEEAKRLVPFC